MPISAREALAGLQPGKPKQDNTLASTLRLATRVLDCDDEKHARIHAQALSQSGPEQNTDVRMSDLDALHAEGGTTEQRGAGQSADRAQHEEERATHERTVRHQTAHGTP